MKKEEVQMSWFDMPEYENIFEQNPYITATFKFKSQADFDLFHERVKTFVYDGQRVFDGIQRKNKKGSTYL